MRNFQIGDVLDVAAWDTVGIVRSVKPFRCQYADSNDWNKTRGYSVLGIEYFQRCCVIGNVSKSSNFNNLYDKLNNH